MLFLFFIIILLYGMYVSWKARNAFDKYNESGSIAMSIGVVFFFSVILVPLNIIITDMNSLLTIRVFGVESAIVSLILLLFGRIIYCYLSLYS